MQEKKTKTILDYLEERRQDDENFEYRHLNGECYQLARTLTSIFGGTIYASTTDNHAIAKIHGTMFDASGIISKKNADNYHKMTQREHDEAAKWGRQKEYHLRK